jgi:hypothetical protein
MQTGCWLSLLVSWLLSCCSIAASFLVAVALSSPSLTLSLSSPSCRCHVVLSCQVVPYPCPIVIPALVFVVAVIPTSLSAYLTSLAAIVGGTVASCCVRLVVPVVVVAIMLFSVACYPIVLLLYVLSHWMGGNLGGWWYSHCGYHHHQRNPYTLQAGGSQRCWE